MPAYNLVRFDRYLLAHCSSRPDVPINASSATSRALRTSAAIENPRQLLAELDFMMSQRAKPASLYFVDDNFIGNRKAAREMLPHLVEWQQRNGYPVSFACEATLNIARQPDILALLRAARFDAVFVGIETPELDALKAIRKEHNASTPMMEAIRTLNGYGLEVVSGIILGLDSDTSLTEQHLKDFIDRSQIPMLTINLLQALPKTALWDRLQREGRLIEDTQRESNVRFLRPYAEVLAMWRRCVAYAYDPDRLYARFMHQVGATYANRLVTPRRRASRLRISSGG